MPGSIGSKHDLRAGTPANKSKPSCTGPPGIFMFESLKRLDLTERQIRLLRRGSSTRPTLRLVEEAGTRAVVKDFSTNRFFYRNTIGRFLVWREHKAYRRLNGIHGVPALYGMVDGLALVIKWIPGRNLENLEKVTTLPESFFEALKELVARCHERGVAHCDLKRAPNVLLGPGGQPYIVDWGAAISSSECRIFPLNRIYRRFLMDDFNAVIKLKLRHLPEAVTLEERNRYEHRSRAERSIRKLRDRLRDLLKKVA